MHDTCGPPRPPVPAARHLPFVTSHFQLSTTPQELIDDQERVGAQATISTTWSNTRIAQITTARYSVSLHGISPSLDRQPCQSLAHHTQTIAQTTWHVHHIILACAPSPLRSIANNSNYLHNTRITQTSTACCYQTVLHGLLTPDRPVPPRLSSSSHFSSIVASSQRPLDHRPSRAALHFVLQERCPRTTISATVSALLAIGDCEVLADPAPILPRSHHRVSGRDTSSFVRLIA